MAITVEYDDYMSWAATQNYGRDLLDLPDEAQDKINAMMDGQTYGHTSESSPDSLVINSILETSFSEFFDENEVEEMQEHDTETLESIVEERGVQLLAREGNKLWVMN